MADQGLTDSAYWDHHWQDARRTGRRGHRLTDDFADGVLMRQYSDLRLPSGSSVIELGSAPGHHLIELRRIFGWDVYGAEYSPVGVTQQRAVFGAAGIPPERVIEADIFSAEFQATWECRFDLVLSRGFIEHFTDPRPAIAAHVRLVKPGGYVWVLIPNYRGVNWALKRFFAPHNLQAHNLSIMRVGVFRSLFEGLGLDLLACGYCGTVHLGMSNPPPGRLRIPYRLATGAQAVLNAGLRVCRRGPETRWLSPYLVYVGRRRDARETRHIDEPRRRSAFIGRLLCSLGHHAWTYTVLASGGELRCCRRCPAAEAMSAAEAREAGWDQMGGI